MTTLHEQLILEAPQGVARRECPGAFDAITARRKDGRVCVRYVGKNDDPRSVEAIMRVQKDFASN